MTNQRLTRTWIITGASQGFGRALLDTALAVGDDVVAAVRRPDSLADLAAAHPDHLAVEAFDAADSSGTDRLVHRNGLPRVRRRLAGTELGSGSWRPTT